MCGQEEATKKYGNLPTYILSPEGDRPSVCPQQSPAIHLHVDGICEQCDQRSQRKRCSK